MDSIFVCIIRISMNISNITIASTFTNYLFRAVKKTWHCISFYMMDAVQLVLHCLTAKHSNKVC